MTDHITAIDRLDDAHAKIRAAALGISAILRSDATLNEAQLLTDLICDLAEDAQAATRTLEQVLQVKAVSE